MLNIEARRDAWLQESAQSVLLLCLLQRVLTVAAYNADFHFYTYFGVTHNRLCRPEAWLHIQ
jgi:hypothetical protein